MAITTGNLHQEKGQDKGLKGKRRPPSQQRDRKGGKKTFLLRSDCGEPSMGKEGEEGVRPSPFGVNDRVKRREKKRKR